MISQRYHTKYTILNSKECTFFSTTRSGTALLKGGERCGGGLGWHCRHGARRRSFQCESRSCQHKVVWAVGSIGDERRRRIDGRYDGYDDETMTMRDKTTIEAGILWPRSCRLCIYLLGQLPIALEFNSVFIFFRNPQSRSLGSDKSPDLLRSPAKKEIKIWASRSKKRRRK